MQSLQRNSFRAATWGLACLALATFARPAGAMTADEAIKLSKKTGKPILALLGTKT